MTTDYFDAVLSMWQSLLELTAEVSPNYQLSPVANDFQRRFFKRNEFNPNTYCFVALAKDRPVGFVNGFIMNPSEIFIQREVGMIENIFVKESFRRKGIGGRLVDSCNEWFLRKQLADIYINVVPANPVSLKFWEAKGYATHKITMCRSV